MTPAPGFTEEDHEHGRRLLHGSAMDRYGFQFQGEKFPTPPERVRAWLLSWVNAWLDRIGTRLVGHEARRKLAALERKLEVAGWVRVEEVGRIDRVAPIERSPKDGVFEWAKNREPGKD